MSSHQPSRRRVLKGVGGVAAATALGTAAGVAAAPRAHAVDGLQQIEHQSFGRMQYYRFKTTALAWNPAVNVLLPDGYTPSKRYPVYYLFHGGAQDFRKFDLEDHIRDLTVGKQLIIVMPDGGTAGWHGDFAQSSLGVRHYEQFHIHQLIPWVDATFSTFAEFAGRAVGGFSMGGFGALKFAHVYYGHFASVSAHSGPANLRSAANLDIVTHWINVSSLAESGTFPLYANGPLSPAWNQQFVSRDNPCEHIDRFRGKRIFLVSGTNQSDVNERFVFGTQREFKGLLNGAGIGYTAYELGGAGDNGGHFVRRDRLVEDINGVVAHLRKAG
ncbi:alpha/beta hydrolase [Flexivirga meconopsidis]|uniref:alpha/beta hydrolase n=1 Tax=Flexivirga meconopsidis TaxID=2977121 RepID=UPI00223FB12C|nr:alpha/beta hydrolase-fold protein [Flexivirga meconopsidis]